VSKESARSQLFSVSQKCRVGPSSEPFQGTGRHRNLVIFQIALTFQRKVWEAIGGREGKKNPEASTSLVAYVGNGKLIRKARVGKSLTEKVEKRGGEGREEK